MEIGLDLRVMLISFTTTSSPLEEIVVLKERYLFSETLQGKKSDFALMLEESKDPCT